MAVTVLNGAFLRIPIQQIEPGPNARGDVGDVSELAASLRAIGQQIPAVVEQVAEEVAEERYRLIDGHRRHAAALKAGLPHLDAVVRQPPTEAVRFIRQLAIQSQAKAFNPMAEARTLHALMFEHNLTRADIARQVGKPEAWVRDRIGLVHLMAEEQAAVERGDLSVGEALWRLRQRREARLAAESSPKANPKPRPKTTALAPQRTYEGHFTPDHRLAAAALERCKTTTGHANRLFVGGVACGECWEASIRADEQTGGIRA